MRFSDEILQARLLNSSTYRTNSTCLSYFNVAQSPLPPFIPAPRPRTDPVNSGRGKHVLHYLCALWLRESCDLPSMQQRFLSQASSCSKLEIRVYNHHGCPYRCSTRSHYQCQLVDLFGDKHGRTRALPAVTFDLFMSNPRSTLGCTSHVIHESHSQNLPKASP
ncbi:hypothetical protein BD311DRAFT_765136 [Dichomitus squalens]|uniref:Uncharacterized protein n=1 Tax=Dichomitus squalens TaxID=114155 RepID=A0A4Q9MDE1_9APHY|nr:hypothetical protein BD311DRAFT_765136 [Dichomitus squalens]